VPEHRPAKRSAHKSASHSRAKRSRKSGEEAEGTRVRPQWSGTLSFGLVSIPVDLYPANRSGSVSLRMLAPDGVRLRRRFVCPEDDVETPSDELVRGYEWEPGKYVVVTDEELESLEPDKTRDIDLRLFVPVDSVDPVYFVRSYFLAPSGDSSKAYHLLLEVMQKEKRAGIATFVMRDKEYLVAIMAHKGLLCAHALRFQDELRKPSVLPDKPPRADKADVDRFVKLIDKHAQAKFELDQLHDEAAEQLRKLAERKAKSGKDVIEADGEGSDESDGEAGADVIDLMQVLKKSLGAAPKKSAG
jgi:DNA end-binding protein Ku